MRLRKSGAKTELWVPLAFEDHQRFESSTSIYWSKTTWPLWSTLSVRRLTSCPTCGLLSTPITRLTEHPTTAVKTVVRT